MTPNVTSEFVSRPVLLLLPGLLCDEATWSAQREALTQVHCLVPSYGSLSSITAMARHVLAMAPAERFSLAGHSMGGRVALEMHRLAPERVQRLAILDSGVDPLAEGEAGASERAKRMALLRIAREQGMRALAQAWAPGMVHPDRLGTPVFEDILAMVERKTPEIFAAQIEALLGRPDARGVLASVECPLLLLCGRQDAWSPLERHRQMQAMQPRAKLVVVEDSGHMTPMEQPEAVTAALADWLGL